MSEQAPDRIVLCEVYRDRAASDVHARAQHYPSFAAASEWLVKAKRVTTLTLLAPAGSPASVTGA